MSSQKQRLCSFIPLNVVLEFLLPELRPRSGRGCETTIFVPVPETAMDEDHRLAGWKNDVGAAG